MQHRISYSYRRCAAGVSVVQVYDTMQVYQCRWFLQACILLSAGSVVQVNTQKAGLHISLDLLLPVVDKGGRADHQGPLRDH